MYETPARLEADSIAQRRRPLHVRSGLDETNRYQYQLELWRWRRRDGETYGPSKPCRFEAPTDEVAKQIAAEILGKPSALSYHLFRKWGGYGLYRLKGDEKIPIHTPE